MYHLQILTPEDTFFDGDIQSLIIPGTSGDLGILSNHAPLITSLKEGTVTITDQNKKKSFYKVNDGFFEVKKNQAILLVDSIGETSSIASHMI